MAVKCSKCQSKLKWEDEVERFLPKNGKSRKVIHMYAHFKAPRDKTSGQVSTFKSKLFPV